MAVNTNVNKNGGIRMRSKHSKIKTTNKNIGKLNMINIIFKIIAFAFAIITIIFYHIYSFFCIYVFNSLSYY